MTKEKVTCHVEANFHLLEQNKLIKKYNSCFFDKYFESFPHYSLSYIYILNIFFLAYSHSIFFK